MNNELYQCSKCIKKATRCYSVGMLVERLVCNCSCHKNTEMTKDNQKPASLETEFAIEEIVRHGIFIYESEMYDFKERKCKKCGRINTHRLDKDGNFTCDGEWEDL